MEKSRSLLFTLFNWQELHFSAVKDARHMKAFFAKASAEQGQ